MGKDPGPPPPQASEVIYDNGKGHRELRDKWERRGRATERSMGKEGSVELHLRSLTSQDQGRYRYLVEINKSADYWLWDLNVKGREDYRIRPGHRNRPASLGRDVLIYCILQNSSKVRIGWMKNNEPIERDEKHEMGMRLGGQMTLTVKEISKKDLGEYQCFYNNKTTAGYGRVKVIETRGKSKRSIQSSIQVTQWPPRYREENLMIGLI